MEKYTEQFAQLITKFTPEEQRKLLRRLKQVIILFSPLKPILFNTEFFDLDFLLYKFCQLDNITIPFNPRWKEISGGVVGPNGEGYTRAFNIICTHAKWPKIH